MADEEDVRTLAEIGAQMGVTRERVRQLEARAKRRMEKAAAAVGARP